MMYPITPKHRSCVMWLEENGLQVNFRSLVMFDFKSKRTSCLAPVVVKCKHGSTLNTMCTYDAHVILSEDNLQKEISTDLQQKLFYLVHKEDINTQTLLGEMVCIV